MYRILLDVIDGKDIYTETTGRMSSELRDFDENIRGQKKGFFGSM